MTLFVTLGEKPVIEYSDGTETVWQIPVDSLIIVAEYTSPTGYWGDDYFLVFVFRDQGEQRCRTASVDAFGSSVALARLSALLHEDLRFGLDGPTDWKSRVLWPRELADQEYFTFTEAQPKSIWQRLLRRWLGPGHDCATSAPVKAYLDRCSTSV